MGAWQDHRSGLGRSKAGPDERGRRLGPHGDGESTWRRPSPPYGKRPLPPHRPDTRVLREAEYEQLAALIKQTPDLTLAELAAALTPKDGKGPSIATVWRATQRLKLPLKKSPIVPPNRTGPT